MLNPRRKALKAIALTFVLASVAVACGDDDDSAGGGGTTTAGTAATGTTGGTAATGTTADTSTGTSGTTAATEGTGAAPTSAGEPAGEPVRGGRLVIGIPDEATLGYDPSTTAVGYGGATEALAMYDTLAAYGADGKAWPYLAESIEPNADATEWTVKLRPGMQFQDGTPVNAEAVKAGFAANSEAGRVLQEGFKVEVVDDLTAKFVFVDPFGAFPDNMATQWSWLKSPTAVEKYGEDYTNNPVGSGPYVFDEWVRDDHLTVKRNENYWRDDVGFLDEVEFRPIIDDSVRKSALEAGDVDAIVVGQSDIDDFRNQDEFQVFEKSAGVGAIIYNMTKPPLDDLRVRQALSMAIDVPAVIESVFDGVGIPATGPLPHDNPYYHEVDYPTYDPDAASALIAEYEEETGNEVKFEYSFTDVPLDQELAQLFQSYWEAVGAKVTLGAPMPESDLQNRRAEKQYDVAISGIPPVIDPDPWLPLFRSDSFLNYGASNSPEIDAAIDASRSEVDVEKRKEAYATLQEELAKQLGWFFFQDSVVAVAVRPGVHGVDSWTLPDGAPGLSKQFWLPFQVDSLWVDQ
jgi:peptide/nickel transport system substrate-binding protein